MEAGWLGKILALLNQKLDASLGFHGRNEATLARMEASLETLVKNQAADHELIKELLPPDGITTQTT